MGAGHTDSNRQADIAQTNNGNPVGQDCEHATMHLIGEKRIQLGLSKADNRSSNILQDGPLRSGRLMPTPAKRWRLGAPTTMRIIRTGRSDTVPNLPAQLRWRRQPATMRKAGNSSFRCSSKGVRSKTELDSRNERGRQGEQVRTAIKTRLPGASERWFLPDGG
jgi:hypothetical protein